MHSHICHPRSKFHGTSLSGCCVRILQDTHLLPRPPDVVGDVGSSYERMELGYRAHTCALHLTIYIGRHVQIAPTTDHEHVEGLLGPADSKETF